MDLVFLHGGGQGGWIWDETIAALERQAPGEHRMLALDVPGCGTRRGRDTAALTFPAIVAELLDDVAAAGMTRAVLVGHSQAGTLIPAMAEAAPGLFARLIYVSCLAPVAGATMMQTVGQLHASPDAPLHGTFGNPEISARDLYAAMFCNDMGAQQREEFIDRLGRDAWPESTLTWTGWRYDHLAGVPSTYVHCLEDCILPPDGQEAFAVRLHCERTVRIDSGHQAQNTRPEGLAEILRLDIQPPA